MENQFSRTALLRGEEATMDMRLLCTFRLDAWKNGVPARLRDKKKTIGSFMNEEDFARLNHRLHAVRKEKK